MCATSNCHKKTRRQSGMALMKDREPKHLADCLLLQKAGYSYEQPSPVKQL